MSDRKGGPFDAKRRNFLLGGSALSVLATGLGSSQLAQAQQTPQERPAQMSTAGRAGQKPNILVIWGDDIGIANISAYSNGLMGYETPNIDRIAPRGSSSSITTPSNPARRAARRSSQASMASAPASRRWAFPAHRWA